MTEKRVREVNGQATYLNRVSGVVDVYPVSVARAFDYLEVVEEGAKTLINPPATPATVAAHIAHHTDGQSADPAGADKPEEQKKDTE